jgi:hypothetical protein
VFDLDLDEAGHFRRKSMRDGREPIAAFCVHVAHVGLSTGSPGLEAGVGPILQFVRIVLDLPRAMLSCGKM